MRRPGKSSRLCGYMKLGFVRSQRLVNTMPKRSSNKYPLVPSVQFRTSRLSPLALMPAVPVRLGGRTGSQLYAAVDTAAKISAISESTLQGLERAQVTKSNRLVETIQGSIEVA